MFWQAKVLTEKVMGRISSLAAAPSVTSDRYVPLELRLEKRALSVLKMVSNDEAEAMEARALALVLRADILPSFGLVTTTMEANYRRRACIFASKADHTAIPENIRDPFDEHGLSNIQPRARFLDCMSSSKEILRILEGEPICVIRSRLPPGFLEDVEGNLPHMGGRNDISEHVSSVGGNGCDYCGKSFALSGISSFKCERCRLTHYCGPECQSMAWDDGHKQHCKQYGVFSHGDNALLCELRGSSHLNGRMVRVVDRAADGKWTVGFLESASGNVRMLKVKTKNLRHHRPFA